MFLKKKTAGSASGGYEWENDGDVIEVPDSLGEELLERRDGEFEEADAPAGHKPSDDAKSDRFQREVAERSAVKARLANESPSGTRLNDGRWAQTDTKGDETVDTGLRDTGAEMAPANVMTGSTAPFATLTPGSSENKPTVPEGGPAAANPAHDEVQHPGVRHEMAGADQRPRQATSTERDTSGGKDDDRKAQSPSHTSSANQKK
jgi:hypothetical protein